ncbi:hypothetical protein [Paenibacillus koleovorans]|uniref:hypothetical protein n=1 Tax=Paenibacillus koleovorans TaxID=121608 RepID=UPI000FDC1436|nr:hypothetical protein [Paenibacillus koleovorans]
MGVFTSKRNQIFGAVLLLLVLIMVYVNFVAPAMEASDSKKKLLAQKQKELQGLKSKAEGSTKGLGAEDQVGLAQARSRVPEVPDVEGLLRDVRMLEVTSRMSLSGYNFEIGKVSDAPKHAAATTAAAQSESSNGAADNGTNPAAAGAPQAPAANLSLAIPIKLNTSARGDYQQIYRFLDELQSSQRIMQVDKLSFSVKSAVPVKLNAPRKEITMNVSLVSYYAPGLQKFYKTPQPVEAAKPVGRTNPIY